MIVKYHGESSPLALLDGKEYPVVSIEAGFYRIIDEEGWEEGYLYPPECFEIVSGSPDEYVDEYLDDNEEENCKS